MNNDNLTIAQRAAVDSDADEILCVAGPGSGKTEVLTRRIRRVIEDGADPRRIVALTYTNEAARNLENRLRTIEVHVGWHPGKNPRHLEPSIVETDIDQTKYPIGTALQTAVTGLGFCGTLHGFALRMLKQHGAVFGYGDRTAVIDEEASTSLLEAKMKSIGCKTSLKKMLELKKEGRPVGYPSKDRIVLLAYYDELREASLVDFDLILTEFLLLPLLFTEQGSVWGKSRPLTFGFTHLFVDEVQDSALIDWAIFRALPIANKFLVGDPDQSIYGFRGGRPDLLVAHSKWVGVATVILEANFRCATEVCSAANRLIGNNTQRLPKMTMSADDHAGRVVLFGQTLNEGEEIAQVLGLIQRFCAQGDDGRKDAIAVLARTNAIATGFREAIAAAGIAVSEAPKEDLPKDFPLARALVEFAAQPSNDTLGFFYLLSRYTIKEVATPLDARKKASEIRREANSRGRTINEQWFSIPENLPLSAVGALLDKAGCCIETRMLVLEKIKALPSDARISDLALEIARTNRPEPPPDSAGVTVTTIHGAKGREWDVVFLVGFEDEVIPGGGEGRDIEEERRIAFVGLTRARLQVYVSHAASRRATWGSCPIIPHTPSRFLKEIFQ